MTLMASRGSPDHPNPTPEYFDPATLMCSVELFPTDHPIPAADLIGRTDDITTLTGELRDGEHRIIIGPDKSGKTSTSSAAAAELDADGWLTVTIDLFRICTIKDLVVALLDAGAIPESDRNGVDTIAGAISILDAHAAATRQRMLLYIDSFQEIATTQLFGKVAVTGTELRTALDTAQHITCLFAGGASTVMRDLFTSKDQPFHHFGRITPLAPIDESAWRTVLPKRFAYGRRELGASGIDRLLELSEGHPRSTMLLAQHSYALAVATGRTAVDREGVDIGLQSALASERLLADTRLGHVRSLSKYALSTAMRVAKGDSPYKNLPPAIARQTLRGLETAGFVDHPHSGMYTIADPMLRLHLLALSEGRSCVSVPAALTQQWATGALLNAASAVQTAPVVADTPRHTLPPAAADPNGKGSAAAVLTPTFDADVAGALASDVGNVTAAFEVVEPEVAMPAVSHVSGSTAGTAKPAAPTPTVSTSAGSAAGTSKPPSKSRAQRPVRQAKAAPRESKVNRMRQWWASRRPPDVETEDHQPKARPATRSVAAAAAGLPAGDVARTALRHPDPREAEAIAEYVVRAMESPDGGEAVESGSARDEFDEMRRRRMSRFIRHSVAEDPEGYWQVEVGNRPVGGVVLHRPNRMIGTGTAAGIDPIVIAGFLGITAALLVIGSVLLIVGRAWDWGAWAGLMFAVLVASMVQIVYLAPSVMARARASLDARRNGGRVFEAIWSEPEMMVAVFRALARKMPGTHITGYAESPEHLAAFRDIGFCVRHKRVVAGVLDPDAERPVRPLADVVADHPSAHAMSEAPAPELEPSTELTASAPAVHVTPAAKPGAAHAVPPSHGPHERPHPHKVTKKRRSRSSGRR